MFTKLSLNSEAFTHSALEEGERYSGGVVFHPAFLRVISI